MTDLEQLHRAMLLDPHDTLARHAYRDAWLEAGNPGEPEIVTHWTCSLRTFMAEAREMFGKHPLATVTLGCRKPGYRASPELGRSGTCWLLDCERVVTNPLMTDLASSRLPEELFRHLSGTPEWLWRIEGDRPDEALAALSDACITLGRNLANLPPLPVCPSPAH